MEQQPGIQDVHKGKEVAAHTQRVTHSYEVHYPPHPPREGDPHYKDFEAYRRRTEDTAVCAIGHECEGGLELHHSHIEFALQNGVELSWLESQYPGVSVIDEVGAWVESAQNLQWLCERHHRGFAGVHSVAASDYEAQKFVKGLFDAKGS